MNQQADTSIVQLTWDLWEILEKSRSSLNNVNGGVLNEPSQSGFHRNGRFPGHMTTMRKCPVLFGQVGKSRQTKHRKQPSAPFKIKAPPWPGMRRAYILKDSVSISAFISLEVKTFSVYLRCSEVVVKYFQSRTSPTLGELMSHRTRVGKFIT